MTPACTTTSPLALARAVSIAALALVPGALGQVPMRWQEKTLTTGGPLVFAATRARVVLAPDSLDQYSGLARVTAHEWDGAAWLARNPRTQLPGRQQFGLAEDPTGGAILFGGASLGGLRDDTWRWDGEDWQPLPAAGRPSPRRLPALAFDSARRRTVLFGGTGVGNALLADTWEWDGSAWQQRPTTTAPPPGWGHTMTYDPRRRRVVLVTTGTSGPAQTWEWDGAQWTQRTTVVAPPAVTWQSACYDSGRGYCLLAQADTVQTLETWMWDGATWRPGGATAVADSAPIHVAYDEARRVAVAVAGRWSPHVLEWDGLAWQVASRDEPTHDQLRRRTFAGTYDLGRRRTVAYGGSSQPAVWEWDGVGWREVQPLSGFNPTPRSGHAIVGDLLRRRLVLFGGVAASGYLGDTWEWDGASWLPRPVSAAPSRRIASLAYDLARGRTVLFGGVTSTGFLDDTWEWDGSSWSLVQPRARPPAGPYPLAYDAGRARTVCVARGPAGLEVWEWDGNDWTNRTPGVGPPDRWEASLAYDWASQCVLLFGGVSTIGGNNVSRNDLWAWDGAAWRNLTPTTSPLPVGRRGAVLVNDPARFRSVLFAGILDRSSTQGGTDIRWLTDLWEYAADPDAASIAYGRGCHSSNGLVTLLPLGEPSLGNSRFALRLLNAPAAAPVVLAVGTALESRPLGAGCTYLVGGGLAFLRAGSSGGGAIDIAVPVPRTPHLLGRSVYAQGAATDQAGVVSSGGLQLRIGY